MYTPPSRLVLRDLPVVPRVVIATFLISVGIGYFSALVQLHFQSATPGRLLPDANDAATIYHGQTGLSQLERLLLTDESKPFNGSGTMVPAFTARSGGWQKAIKKIAKDKNLSLPQAEQALRAERSGERLVLLDWIHHVADNPENPALKKAYDEDDYPVPAKLADHSITQKMVQEAAGPNEARRVKIKSILSARCERCHSANVGGAGAQFPLESFDEVRDYCEVESAGGGMSLKKLAQSTHVHLLGFSMLYGLTGLIFAFTSYPGWVRLLVAPAPLLFQLADIACWWLGRLDPLFAQSIIVTGGAVGGTLFLQIILSLFNMFSSKGKTSLVLLILAGIAAGIVVRERVIAPYLTKEGMNATAPE